MRDGDVMQRGVLARLGRHAGAHKASVRTFAVAIVVVGIVGYVLMHTARQPQVHQAPVITMVMIQPQKPPPPPPPLLQPKMIVQPKMVTPETKPMQQPSPKNAPRKPAAPAAVQMGTSIHNNAAADSFNLSGTPGGDGMLDGGGGGGGGSRWGYYAGMVQTQVQEALQRNRVTRNITAGLEVRIWADARGVVTRIVLDKSSGDPAVDDAVENQVLRNLQLNQPPPSDMPMPIVMSLTGEQTMQ